MKCFIVLKFFSFIIIIIKKKALPIENFFKMSFFYNNSSIHVHVFKNQPFKLLNDLIFSCLYINKNNMCHFVDNQIEV